MISLSEFIFPDFQIARHPENNTLRKSFLFLSKSRNELILITLVSMEKRVSLSDDNVETD